MTSDLPGMPHPEQRTGPRFAREKREALESFARFARGEALPRYPLDVFLEVSNVCDLKCAMCPRFSALNPDRLALIRAEARGFMNVDELARAIGGLLPHALTVYVFGYGEPTIHPQFRRLLSFLWGYEVLIEFFTNGMHLDEELVEQLVEQGVHRVTLSLSGSSRKEYENVYLGGDFQRVLAGLARLRDRRRAAGTSYPVVEVNSLSFRHHVKGLDRFVTLMAEYGVDQVNVTPLHEHAESVPQLLGHAAPPASLANDRVAAKAEQLARRLGLRLNIHPALRYPPGVLRQPSRGEEEEPVRPPRPRVPVRAFAELAHRVEVKPAPTELQPPPDALDPEHASVDQARLVLRPQRIRELAEHGKDFVCLEAFKSIYIRRNGQVKVCCFMQDDIPALGSTTRNDALSIWRGTGFRAFRHSLLNSEYPLAACAYCLLHQQAPESHGIDVRAGEYARWHAARFGGNAEAERVGQLALELAGLGDGQHIVGRMVAGASPLLLDDDLLDRARRLLSVVARVDRVLGPYRTLFEGYLDVPGHDSVTGWVWSPVFPELRFPVVCRVGGRVIGETVAHAYRPDLLAAGKGDGRYGFGFRLDPGSLGADELELSVCLGDTRCELDGSPRRLALAPATGESPTP